MIHLSHHKVNTKLACENKDMEASAMKKIIIIILIIAVLAFALGYYLTLRFSAGV